MKILVFNIWPEWPSGRHYFDFKNDEVWFVCDEAGARYVRNYVGAKAVKGITMVRSSDVRELIALLTQTYEEFPFERVVAIDEFCVLPAAFVRDHFGIPGPTVAQVEPFRNKRKMKDTVAAAGIRVIPDLELEQLDRGPFVPCVVKRTDGAASDGVYICRTYEEFQAHRDGLDRGALLEQYVPGNVFHIDGAFNDSGLVAMPHSYINTCYEHYRYGTPHGSVTVDDPLLKSRLVEFARAVLAAMPLRKGIFHLEVIRTPNDELVFLEIACRIGGGEIFTNFTDVYNFDLLAFCIESQLGRDPPLPELQQEDAAGWLMLNGFEHVPGIFTGIRCGTLAENNCAYTMRPPRLGRKVTDRARYFVTFALRGASSVEVRAGIQDLIANVTLESKPLDPPSAVAG